MNPFAGWFSEQSGPGLRDRFSGWWSEVPAASDVFLTPTDISNVAAHTAGYVAPTVKAWLPEVLTRYLTHLKNQVVHGEITPSEAKLKAEQAIRADTNVLKSIFPKFMKTIALLGLTGAAAFKLWKHYVRKRHDTARVRFLEHRLKQNPSVKNVTKLVKEVLKSEPKRRSPRRPVVRAPKYLTNKGFPVAPRKRSSSAKKAKRSKSKKSRRRSR